GAKPMIRGFVLPARDWTIEDTWKVAGLKGTGSHHVSLTECVVPSANFFDLMQGEPCVVSALSHAVPHTLPVVHGAFNVGTAEGAIDDLVALAATGKQQFKASVAMRESELFQIELGRIEADVRAARALMQVQADGHWRRALAGTLRDYARMIEAAQAGS